MNKIKKILFARMPTSIIIMMLRSIALILIVVISYLIYQNWQENLSLIGAFGILISALLASYSVILNIDTTVNLKRREYSNQVRNTFFQLCLVKMRLIALENEKVREKITYLDIDRILDSVEDIYQLLNELKSQDIVSIAHNDVLTDVNLVYLNINILYTNMRALRKNLIKPTPSKDSSPIYKNPMITINFKLDDTIKRLTNILTYLKDGYDKDFKTDGNGIEACADYYYGMTKKLETKFCKVNYLEKQNAILCEWQHFCQGNDYREPLEFGLELLLKTGATTWITDTTNGFENEEEDTKWLLEEFLPKVLYTNCKKLVFIIKQDSPLKAEIDTQAVDLGEYFEVLQVEKLEDLK